MINFRFDSEISPIFYDFLQGITHCEMWIKFGFWGSVISHKVSKLSNTSKI